MTTVSTTVDSDSGFACFAMFLAMAIQFHGSVAIADVTTYQWDVVNPSADWAPRAGLQVVDQNGEFYLMGGRTPVDPNVLPVFGASEIWADVWKSNSHGADWELILDTDSPNHWPGR